MTIKTDVSKDVQYYIAERQNQFPGVRSQQIYLRNYPLNDAGRAAVRDGRADHAEEVARRALPRDLADAIVGQSGLESYYDRYLRGHDGTEQVQVDALGAPTGDRRDASRGRATS